MSDHVTTDTKGQGAGFRPDIEGLRGLAVGLVVLFHAGLLGVGGGFIGVDVFFVISGFLITGLLVRERERTGRIGFTAFYARRIRRLAPAAIVVVALTLPFAWLAIDPLNRPDMLRDATAVSLSVGNIRFALSEGDYFTAIANPSPFLHFWSLAVEEQFYLVWPVILALVARGRVPTRKIGIALAVIGIASFVASILVTDLAANWAFYSLPTRAWELAAGGLLAIAGSRLARIPARLLAIAGWAGLAAVAGSAFLFDSGTPWPGAGALLPVAGTVALIAAGMTGAGPGRLLALRPLRALGRISYSLYLIHWPVLVLPAIALAGANPETGGLLDDPTRAGLVGVALVLATLSWRFVEEPFRRGFGGFSFSPRPLLAGGTAILAAMAILTSGLAWQAETTLALVGTDGATTGSVMSPVPGDDTAIVSDDPNATPNPNYPDPTMDPTSTTDPTAGPTGTPGASPTTDPTANPTAKPKPVSYRLPADVNPRLADARNDIPYAKLDADHCLAYERVTAPPNCSYGTGSFSVALVGDSHAAQWFPALLAIAKDRGWKLTTFAKVSCPFLDMRVNNVSLKREYTECAAWNDNVVAKLNSLDPNLILVSMSRIAIHPTLGSDGSVSAQGSALARMIKRLQSPVTMIVDTPYGGVDVPACLSAHTADIRPCAASHSVAFGHDLGDRERAAAKATGAHLIDLTRTICPGSPCLPVVNGIITFRDIGHLTGTFVKSLRPELAAALDKVLAGG